MMIHKSYIINHVKFLHLHILAITKQQNSHRTQIPRVLEILNLDLVSLLTKTLFSFSHGLGLKILIF